MNTKAMIGNRPVVLLDEKRSRNNIRRMVQKADKNGLTLRPHFKTHQSAKVGAWFKEEGINRCTVSSVQMASYFAKTGWADITIAFPVNTLEWGELCAIAESSNLNVTVTSPDSIEPLLDKTGVKLGVFIKIELGTFRTGFDPGDLSVLSAAIHRIENHPDYTFKGFLGHAGHTYNCRTREEIQAVHNQSKGILLGLKQHFIEEYPNIIISPGDTPSCSVAEGWEGVDEIRPGNYVYYDVTQSVIGSCDLKDIAVALACPVVAKHEDRHSIIVYGGGIHLSKDRIEWNDNSIYGLPCLLNDKGWELPDGKSYISGVSQEHGVIQATPEFYDSVSVGDHLAILPVHSCMMCDLMKSVKTIPAGDLYPMMSYAQW